jgi:hypothetical protein
LLASKLAGIKKNQKNAAQNADCFSSISEIENSEKRQEATSEKGCFSLLRYIAINQSAQKEKVLFGETTEGYLVTTSN